MIFSLLLLCLLHALVQADDVDEFEARARAHFGDAASHTNNWVVLVETSRFWFNYRHPGALFATVDGVNRAHTVGGQPTCWRCTARSSGSAFRTRTSF